MDWFSPVASKSRTWKYIWNDCIRLLNPQVNCLHFVKPFAEMVVFTDLDDMCAKIKEIFTLSLQADAAGSDGSEAGHQSGYPQGKLFPK